MNRSAQMDDFLQYWAKIYIQNPNYAVDTDDLYISLMNYGLTEQEYLNSSIESNFSRWISHFDKNPNLRVYHDARQPAFLQFRSRGDLGTQHVKLYLSYPPDKMEYCVNKIFDYVAKNKMVNGSKVANRVRSDSIVLRMTNYDDAIKVMEFINSDPELVMYAKPTNPFMMRNGKVAVSYDDNISYNSTLAMMMKEYFNYCRQNQKLQNVSHRDFRDYVNAYYQNTFRDSNLLRNFRYKSEVVGMTKRFESVGDCLNNYAQVLKLLVMQLDGSMNMERYRSFYLEVKDYSRNQQWAQYYENLLKGIPQKREEKVEETADMAEIAIINSYIQFAKRKYQKTSSVIAYLKKYVEEENINAITRDGNFREKFQNGMTPKRARFIMQDNIEKYVEKVVSEEKEEETENTLSMPEQLLQEYIDVARVKYGDSKVALYLNKYVSDGLGCITRDHNFRERFLQYLPAAELLNITNQNIFAYVQGYIQVKNGKVATETKSESLYDIFIKACVATYQKYGYNQLSKAIECGLMQNYSYFTDGNGQYRTYLMNASKDDMTNFCFKLLSTYGVQIGDNEAVWDKCARAIEQMLMMTYKQPEKQGGKYTA